MLEVEATLIKLAAPSPLPTAAKQEEPTAEKDAMVEPFEVGETVSLTDEDEDVALGTMGTVLGYTDEGFIEVDFPEVGNREDIKGCIFRVFSFVPSISIPSARVLKQIVKKLALHFLRGRPGNPRGRGG